MIMDNLILTTEILYRAVKRRGRSIKPFEVSENKGIERGKINSPAREN